MHLQREALNTEALDFDGSRKLAKLQAGIEAMEIVLTASDMRNLYKKKKKKKTINIEVKTMKQ